MENKIRYQFDRLPMVLFIACLVVTVVAATRTYADESIDNLVSPVYFGDLNVTEGKQFWIRCQAEPPISWYKDEEPIENHLLRHSKEDFEYQIRESQRKGAKAKHESTLLVSRAYLRHKGKYQCNKNHEISHHLHVHAAPIEPSVIEREEVEQRFTPFESDNDHEDLRIVERPMEDDKPIPMTMTESPRLASPEFESTLEYDEEKSHEKFIEEPTNAFDTRSTSPAPTDATSPAITSFTNIPIHSTNAHPTHATTHTKHVAHTTHVVPSEVKTQIHPEIHRHKGKLAPLKDQKSLTLYRIGKPLKLTCNAENPADNKKIIWSRYEGDDDDDKKVAKDVREINELKGRFQIIPAEGHFGIDKASEDDAGNYSCSLDGESHKFNVYAAVLVRVPDSVYSIEEEKMEIICIVKGTNPVLSWDYRSENGNVSFIVDETQDRLKLSKVDDVEDAKLTIEKISLSDRGYYTCTGYNDAMEESDRAKSEAFVRIKDKLAALWPFLGICAEVFVLCAIILIYEKRRNKTDLDESDTDQSPDQKNDKDSDVRHRK